MNQDYNTRKEISVAPMMDWTDRHCRFFHRLISPHAKLYTEMITAGALLHGDTERFLRYNESEHPLALQLGGSDPKELKKCAKLGETYRYDEINLNCGCPSDRVQKGRFGACLMKEPDHVADCVEAMTEATDIPITVKCRIGVDDRDSYDFLCEFVDKIADKGCKTFIIHARKAWLKGLSPKENREKPPLDYPRVEKLKEDFPQLRIILNGGLNTLKDIQSNLKIFDGAMIGREAYQNPYFLAEIERKIFGNHVIMGREKVARAMSEYAEIQQKQYDTPIKSITRHIIGLYHHQPGARTWRQTLSTLPYQPSADSGVIAEALTAQKIAALKSLKNAA